MVDDKNAQASTDTNPPNPSPSYQDQQSISGTNPASSSDDDTLKNAQDMGQQQNEDSEHPEELDIARDVNKAEEALQNH